MVKVITYGTYDLLHYGHIRLLERAKALGDYLIVGVTADDFDKTRGKINVQQSLMERIEAVRATGLADEIIVEEYEGQKIDDIRRYDVDIFTVGSDWVGKFDYLKEYCKVVYLDRTEGISSSEIRSEKREIKLGLVGDSADLNKFYNESKFVNGLKVSSIFTNNVNTVTNELKNISCKSYIELLGNCDAVYIRSLPELHYEQIKVALESGKHVLCESPLTLNSIETEKLCEIAKKNKLILMEAIKTAYATAFNRLVLLVKSGKIGEIVSIDTTCTSLNRGRTNWPGFYEWGPTAMLPVFELLGTNFDSLRIVTRRDDKKEDSFTRIEFLYPRSVATVTVGNGVKSEGDLVVSGTSGYIYVPAPWWKTDYFEVRYEDTNQNKRYFYQLEGEGIRYELLSFVKSIENDKLQSNISSDTTTAIEKVMMDYVSENNMVLI